MKKWFKLVLNFLGVVYVLTSLLAFFNSFYFGPWHNIFWFCYSGILLIGIGILTRNKVIFMSQLYILFIPDFIWFVDFISYLIRGSSFFGIVNYFFLPAPFLTKLVTLQHIFTIPTALFLSYKFSGRNKRSLSVAFLQLIILFLLTRFFTLPENNINCAYLFCGKYGFGFASSWYPFVWFAGAFLMIYLSYLFLNSLHEIVRNLRKEL